MGLCESGVEKGSQNIALDSNEYMDEVEIEVNASVSGRGLELDGSSFNYCCWRVTGAGADSEETLRRLGSELSRVCSDIQGVRMWNQEPACA